MTLHANKVLPSAAPSAARIAAGLVALLVSGCALHPIAPVRASLTPFGREVTLIYVPGIGGLGRDDRGFIQGLRAGGFDGKITIFDWTGRLGAISALWAHPRQQAEARKIAQQVRQLRTESPAKAIVLVGHSAGAGVAVKALEDLPPTQRVDQLLLLAPALSRAYDLGPALRHVRGRADVFSSERDTLVLAMGTFLFGTVDGVHGEAAGHAGFIEPRDAEPNAYAKLHPHPYSGERQQAGDDGGHQGVLSPGVAAAVVAPLLTRSDPPDVATADAH